VQAEAVSAKVLLEFLDAVFALGAAVVELTQTPKSRPAIS
jgi:hypothetical protein